MMTKEASAEATVRKIRDLNLQLISVKQVKLDGENEALANAEGGADAD